MTGIERDLFWNASSDDADVLEWLACRPPSATDRQQLGIGQDTGNAGHCRVGKMPVRIDAGLFVPDMDSRLTLFIMPVLDAPWTEGGELFDFVGWHFANPNRWWLRHGLADALGRWNASAGAEPVDVSVWRTPLAWLRAGGSGLCLLTDFQPEQCAILSSMHGIVAEDMGHRDELARLLRMPYRGPVVRVAEQRAAA